MKLYLIRHGEPNYKDNCLTPMGHLQAEALARRLEKGGKKYSAIYSSNYGRAVETAEHTAVRLGMDLRRLDFMHELSYGKHGATREEKILYSPWKAPKGLVENDVRLPAYDYADYWGFRGTKLEESEERIIGGFDAWLAENHGFVRDGTRYLCTREDNDEILIFAHGGTISMLLGHFMNTGTIAACMSLRIYLTSISTIDFRSDPGAFVLPAIRGISDFAHCEGISYTDPEEGCFGQDVLPGEIP